MPKSRAETGATVEKALLAFLHFQPMHGYELHHQMGEPGGPGEVLELKQGQLYGLLSRLETAGLVEAEKMRQGSRPPRKVFRLTPVGEQAFRSWVEAPVRHARLVRQDFLIKLYFARLESTDVALRLIRAQKSVCNAWLDANRATLSDVSAGAYDQMVHEFRAGQIQAILDWLDRCAQAEAGRLRTAQDRRG